jgi:hypothetical protein
VLLEVELERVCEQLANVVLRAPRERAAGAGRRRRQERPHHPEHLAEPAFGRPAREGESPAWLGDTRQLPGDRLVFRREHHAARRGHDVEARIRVRHRLGVSDFELHLYALLRGPLTGGVDEHGREILADDVSTPLCGENRDGARARGRVERLLAGLRIDALDDELVDVADVRDALVGAVAPHHALTGLQLGECHSRLSLVQ